MSVTAADFPAFDWSDHPSGPVVLITKVIDIILGPFVGSSWRNSFPSNWSWIQQQYDVSICTTIFRPLLTYGDYIAESSLNYYSFSSLYSYAFQTNSTSLGILTSYEALLVLFFLVMIFHFSKAILIPIFSSIGRRAGRATHGLEWELYNEIRIQKFGEYVFRLLYHFLIATYGISYFSDKIWWDESRGGTIYLFLGFPFHPVEPDMAWYYLIQSAYNLEALIHLIQLSFKITIQTPSRKTFYMPITITWSSTVRGDFREMCIHHIVTNMLIIGSSFFRLTRIGSMVFMVHDISDIPVDMSKLANFLKWKVATAICFGIMVLFWLIFRLGMLPFSIVRASLFESHLVLETGETPLACFIVYRSFFILLLILIIALHAAWFGMFIRMGYYLVFKGETHDLSEHKTGEDQTLIPNSSSEGSKNKDE
jgi:hypothetical protein